jgi:excisionase family DNA binding protein
MNIEIPELNIIDERLERIENELKQIKSRFFITDSEKHTEVIESPLYLNVKEASKYIHLSEITVYKYVSSRQIPFFKIERSTLFKQTDLDEWMKKKRVVPIG